MGQFNSYAYLKRSRRQIFHDNGKGIDFCDVGEAEELHDVRVVELNKQKFADQFKVELRVVRTATEQTSCITLISFRKSSSFSSIEKL